MSIKTEHKVYIAAGLLVALAVALYMVLRESGTASRAREAAPIDSSSAAALPKVKLGAEDIAAITKVEIKNKEKGDVLLEKTGTKKEGDKDVDVWVLGAPLKAPANAANVKAMLDNLEKVDVSELVSSRPDYEKYDLTDDKAVHVIASKADGVALDMYFGKAGSRGQLARVAGRDGVYVVKKDSYASYQYKRELKAWRETKIWKFEADNAVAVEIENKNGLFGFSKNDDKWSQSFKKRNDKGKLGDKPVEQWDAFKADKVKEMLRALQALNAEDFAAEGADTGLDDAVTHGGIVRVTLKDNAGTKVLKIGKVQKGESRFALAEGGDGTTYVLGSWTAKWAVADQKAFEESARPAEGDGPPMPPMPPGGHGDEPPLDDEP